MECSYCSGLLVIKDMQCMFEFCLGYEEVHVPALKPKPYESGEVMPISTLLSE